MTDWKYHSYAQGIALPRDGLAGAWDAFVAFVTRSPRRMGKRTITITLYTQRTPDGGLILANVQAEVSA